MDKVKRAGMVMLASLGFLYFLTACTNSDGIITTGKINVVAAENFYGDIVAQIGGGHVNVTSVLSDPEIDPHEYESNVANGMAVAKAQLIVKNGGGYDEWMDKLMGASPNDARAVVTGFDIAPSKLPDNEHVWYSSENMRAVAQAIADALKKQDATHASDYDNNLKKFDNSLQQITQQLNKIKGQYTGTPIGLTENIFLYQTNPMGLVVRTPEAFQKAVAEGNDPPASAVATANNQVAKGEIKVLIYNKQTATPITTKLQQDAQTHNIPIMPVTETMPKGKTYQGWMLDQLSALTQALKTSTGK